MNRRVLDPQEKPPAMDPAEFAIDALPGGMGDEAWSSLTMEHKPCGMEWELQSWGGTLADIIDLAEKHVGGRCLRH